MLEKAVEDHLVRMVKKQGGLAIKIIPVSMSGFPDRIVLLPGAKFFPVELKRPGQKPRKLQGAVHRILAQLGFSVYVLDTKEAVTAAVKEMVGWGN